ncbi:hypothetical protein [Halobacillus seohaensis]|uniref:Uncharacterized protein n=1 Tax=Halobacillus seohaensis TaxID=447421 RepID=A0ABW2EEX8_9BACI
MDKEVKPPKISDKTMKEMAEFFMKTSVPRIIEKRKKEKEEKEND